MSMTKDIVTLNVFNHH